MLRKLLLTAALAVGTFATLAITPTAEARPPIQRGCDDCDAGRGRFDRGARYEVLVRHKDHWDTYGKYRDRDDAQRAARQLRHKGFKVKIDGC